MSACKVAKAVMGDGAGTASMEPAHPLAVTMREEAAKVDSAESVGTEGLHPRSGFALAALPPFMQTWPWFRVRGEPVVLEATVGIMVRLSDVNPMRMFQRLPQVDMAVPEAITEVCPP